MIRLSAVARPPAALSITFPSMSFSFVHCLRRHHDDATQSSSVLHAAAHEADRPPSFLFAAPQPAPRDEGLRRQSSRARMAWAGAPFGWRKAPHPGARGQARRPRAAALVRAGRRPPSPARASVAVPRCTPVARGGDRIPHILRASDASAAGRIDARARRTDPKAMGIGGAHAASRRIARVPRRGCVPSCGRWPSWP